MPDLNFLAAQSPRLLIHKRQGLTFRPAWLQSLRRCYTFLSPHCRAALRHPHHPMWTAIVHILLKSLSSTRTAAHNPVIPNQILGLLCVTYCNLIPSTVIPIPIPPHTDIPLLVPSLLLVNQHLRFPDHRHRAQLLFLLPRSARTHQPQGYRCVCR